VRRAIAVLGCALLVAAAGCSRDRSPRTTILPTQVPSTPAATPCSVDGASTKPRESASQQVGPVVDVRPNAEGCPRIVFEFKDNIPGYKVAYAEPPFSECGSGAEVATASWDADAFIDVRLEPSGGPDLSSDEGEPYYKGPRDIPVNGDVLKHLKVNCDFEAVFEWIIGLDAKHPFDVTTFEDPPRLVIDVSET
jgi:hypothetical protein